LEHGSRARAPSGFSVSAKRGALRRDLPRRDRLPRSGRAAPCANSPSPSRSAKERRLRALFAPDGGRGSPGNRVEHRARMIEVAETDCRCFRPSAGDSPAALGPARRRFPAAFRALERTHELAHEPRLPPRRPGPAAFGALHGARAAAAWRRGPSSPFDAIIEAGDDR